jgi:hypothetical protein
LEFIFSKRDRIEFFWDIFYVFSLRGWLLASINTPANPGLAVAVLDGSLKIIAIIQIWNSDGKNDRLYPYKLRGINNDFDISN